MWRRVKLPPDQKNWDLNPLSFECTLVWYAECGAWVSKPEHNSDLGSVDPLHRELTDRRTEDVVSSLNKCSDMQQQLVQTNVQNQISG